MIGKMVSNHQHVIHQHEFQALLNKTSYGLTWIKKQFLKFMHAPTDIHLMAAKRVLRYLRGSLHLSITFSPGSLELHAYSDVDWVGDPHTRRSTTGYIVFLGTNPLTWVSKKQPIVSRSQTEAEYRALVVGLQNVVI